MQTMESKVPIISYCGLYCTNCKSYRKGKCLGCAENAKATWCKVRSCCIENSFKSCADCTDFANPKDCKKFNNFVSKVFALVFRSDRAASISMIQREGYESYSKYCVQNSVMVIRKN